MDPEERKKINDALSDQKTIQQLSDSGETARRKRRELQELREKRKREDKERQDSTHDLSKK